jgi:hypothetical protein
MRGNGSFVDDQRGVSAVLGFVLMFALVMTTFAIYQSDVVPHQNAEVESSYSQSLDGEVSELRSTTMDVAANGASASETVQGAPDYPDRALGINAPPPKSRLSTTAKHNMSIEGLEAPPEQYWNGTNRTFETRLLALEPSYNYIRTEETYYLANGVGVHESGNGSYASSVGGEVVDGDQIDIVLFDGDVDQQASVHDVSLEPVSTNSEYHSVTPEDDASIELPTVRSESAWTEIAAENPNVNDTEVTCGDGSDPPCDARVNTVEIELNDSVESYDFRVTKVSLEEPSSPDGTYVTMQQANSSTSSGDQTFIVTVRDKYGNPVADADVSLSQTGRGTLTKSSVTTDTDGQATFGIMNAEISATTVSAEINGGSKPYENVTQTVGGDGVNIFGVYNNGQLYKNIGDANKINISDIYAIEISTETCLLGDLLFGVLGPITCADLDIDTSRFTATLYGESTNYELAVSFVDLNQNGKVASGDSYEDYGLLNILEDDAKVEISGGSTDFSGRLDADKANKLFEDKEGKINILSSPSYQSTDGSLPDFSDENIERIYINQADGHATVEVSS